eukprot:30497-Pelagococcus_subviridis.AAC.38
MCVFNSASGRSSLKKHSLHNFSFVLNAPAMNAYVIFMLAMNDRFRNRFTISPFPEGGTDASSASPDNGGGSPVNRRWHTSPPNECPTRMGGAPDAFDTNAHASLTSAACSSSVPATATPLGTSLPPCPRSETA